MIYILTNPSFPEYVKIGYADDIDRRLEQLNRSECIPYAFRVYATYEVGHRLQDKNIHAIIDKLNPNLRSIETFNGKKRVREFYAMSPETAYDILEAIAEINGYTDRLKKIQPNASEQEDENTAEDIQEQKIERLSPFSFSKCQIPVGASIVFWRGANEKTDITCTVNGDKSVEYQGKNWSLSALATMLLQSKWTVAGPRYFKYNDEWLNDIRKRLGV